MSLGVRHLARRRWLQRRDVARNRPLLVGGGMLLVLLATVLSVAAFPGTNLASAAVQRAKSFLELVEQRSPGQRTKAQLTKIKHKIAARPHERALPKVRMAVPILPPAPAVALFDLVAPAPPVQTASIQAIP